MLNFFNNIEEHSKIFLKIFIFLPFIFAFIIGILGKLKNPIVLRRISEIVCFFEFILVSILMLFSNEISFSVYGFEFSFDKATSFLIFSLTLAYFLFAILSKSFLNKLYRLFWSAFLLLFGLINVLILSNNVFASIVMTFFVFLCVYLLNFVFSPKDKSKFEIQLKSDIFLFFLALILIIFDFSRYFVLNEIPFDFSKITENLYHINNSSILIAFIGFLIVLFRFAGFIPFCGKVLSNSNKTNSFISSLSLVSFYAITSYFLIKIVQVFDFLFYDYEDYISLFLILNFIYFTIISFKQNDLIKFLYSFTPAYFAMSVFSIFSFEEKGLITFLYSSVTYLIVLSFVLAVFLLVEKFFKSKEDDEFNKIAGLLKYFSIFAFLVLLKAPLTPLFSSGLLNLTAIFSTDYEGIILNVSAYIILFNMFLMALSVLNLFYRTLIEPQIQTGAEVKISKHQLLTLIISALGVVLVGVCPQYFFNVTF